MYATEGHSAQATNDDRRTERVSMSEVTAMVQKMHVSGAGESNKSSAKAPVCNVYYGIWRTILQEYAHAVYR